MSARAGGLIAIAATLMVIGTVLLGWVSVPVVGALAGVASRELRVPPLWIGVAGLVAWGAILAWQGLGGAMGAVAGTLGGVLGVPGVVPVLATLALAFVLAWTAAIVAAELRRLISGPLAHTKSGT